MRDLILDGFDSKLIDIDNVNTDLNTTALIRTRLLAMAQILFGGRVVVTEGWGVDSLAFLIIGSEIAQATKTFSGDQIPRGAISPLVMERRRKKDYLGIFKEYLDRREVRWHAFRPEFDNQELRTGLSSSIAGSKNLAYEDFFKKISDGVKKNQQRVSALQNVAEYFDGAHGRYIDVEPEPGLFNSELKVIIKDFTERQRSWRDNEISHALLDFYGSMDSYEGGFATATSAMDFIDGRAPEYLQKHLLGAVNGAFLAVSARLTKADRTTPPATEVEDFTTWLFNNVDFREGDPIDASRLRFTRDRVAETAIGKKILQETMWQPIWLKVIELAYDREWKSRVLDLTKAAQTRPMAEVLESSVFSKLETMFAGKISELSLRQSGLERVRLALGHEPKLSKFETVVGPAMYQVLAIGALSSLAYLDFKAAAIVGLAGVTLNRILPKAVDLDPASDQASLFSKRVTPLKSMAAATLHNVELL